MVNISENLIPDGHPNRIGTAMLIRWAIGVHWTQNDRPDMTALANDDWFSRPFVRKPELAAQSWAKQWFEEDGVTQFHFGSAHEIADENGVVVCIPDTEEAWHWGESVNDSNGNPLWDQSLKDNEYDGRQRIARVLFKDLPNLYGWGLEISNNGDWEKAVNVAIARIVEKCIAWGVGIDVTSSLAPQEINGPPDPGFIYMMRHFDVTGKNCPEPLVVSYPDWVKMVTQVDALIRNS